MKICKDGQGNNKTEFLIFVTKFPCWQRCNERFSYGPKQHADQVAGYLTNRTDWDHKIVALVQLCTRIANQFRTSNSVELIHS